MMDAATRKLLREARKASNFPYNTCPASRHVFIMAEALAKGQRYIMLEEEPEHCAGSMLAVVAALWAARAEPEGRGGMSDIVERLRGAREWVGFPAVPICAEAADEIERLREALKTCESWIERWTAHVGNCKGGVDCTCGRTAALFEARTALAGEQEKVG